MRASKKILTLMLFALIAAPGGGSLAGSPTTVPVGTVIPLKMETQLSSGAAQPGDPFTATVSRDVEIDLPVGSSANTGHDRLLIIPADSRVEGHVVEARKAERMSRPGTIAVTFDRLILPGGRSIQIDGTLTSLDASARERLEDLGEDDQIEGDSRTRRAIIFIGAGAGAGAAIGAITEGGKGAAVGAGIGAVIGTIGVLLSRGQEAEISPGTEFGMRVERAFTVDTDEIIAPDDRPRRAMNHQYYDDLDDYNKDHDDADYDSDSENLGTGFGSSPTAAPSSSEEIRAAQAALAERGYYRGRINGEMTRATSRALRRFQRDNRLAATGELTPETLQKLDAVIRP